MTTTEMLKNDMATERGTGWAASAEGPHGEILIRRHFVSDGTTWTLEAAVGPGQSYSALRDSLTDVVAAIREAKIDPDVLVWDVRVWTHRRTLEAKA